MGRSLHTTTETARIGVAHCGNRYPDKNLNKKCCRVWYEGTVNSVGYQVA